MMFPVAVGLMQYIIHNPLQQWFSTGGSPDHKGFGDPLQQWLRGPREDLENHKNHKNINQ